VDDANSQCQLHQRTKGRLNYAHAIEDSYSSAHPWKTIFLLYGQDKRRLALTLIFFLLKQSPTWIVPLVTANIINVVSDPAHHPPRELWINALVGVAATLQNTVTHTVYYRHMSLAARDAEAGMRSAICRRLQQLTISYYKHKSSGALQSKALRDVEAVDQMVRGLFDSGMSAIVALTSAIIITAWRAPYFLPLFLLVVPPVCLLRWALARRMQRANAEFRREIEGMSSRIGNMIDMIPVARAHAVEDVEIAKIDTHLGQVKDSGLRVDLNNAIFGSMSWVLFTLLNLVGLVSAAWMCYHKVMPLRPGDVVLLSGYFNSISGAVLQVVNIFPSLTKGFESIRSIGDILECPDLEQNRGKARIDKVRGEFVFDAIEFTYPGVDTPAIRDFKLDVPAGTTVALVGQSGSGKSTMMGLVLGYQRPSRGAIVLDGKPMESLDLRTYREHVAVVSQETLLFQGTLRDNILYGAEDVSEERLWQAIKDANAYDFVTKLPDGLQTMLGEKGARLSGGQKQRIAIARAIIRNPRVLILDEATSALDSESEYLVQEALDRLMKQRTTFVVAHRLSTIRNADKIVVMENGLIRESGTLDELLNHDGPFAAMYNLQIGGLQSRRLTGAALD
jgi:ATP-binding cassette subfamily B protein